MDDTARCKNQLASFRIKELKDVLTRLGLPKQGKKQVLMDKIMAVLAPPDWQQHTQKVKSGSLRSSVNREEAAKVIDDIYRKLRGLGSAVELASIPRNVSSVSVTAARSDEQDETNAWELRCPCGSSADNGSTTIQCENQACNVWQHLNCVVISETVTPGVDPEIPAQFFCEMCRINYADPYCVTVAQPLYPVKFLAPPGPKMEGTNPLHCVDKTFTLTKFDRELLHKQSHDLQVWCILLNDKVPYRMHWPTYAELRVNGVYVRVTTRTGTQLLGVNGRDDGPVVTSCAREGPNKISLQACDARPFCIGIRVVRRLTVDQVMSQIPSVSAGETFEDAVARVNKAINGSNAEAGNAGDDDDSDIEVVSDSVTFNLSCPLSGSRINVAGRFKPCAHMGGFDLRTFVEMNQRTRKWQCPVCMKNYTIEQLIIDPFFNRVATTMRSAGYDEDVKVIELKTDGFWRPKREGDAKDSEPWRNPEGSLVLANGKARAVVKVEEGTTSQERKPLKIGIKRGQDGTWTVNRSSKNPPWTSAAAKEPSFSRSSSATDSNNEDDDRSVNQESYLNEHTGENGNGNGNYHPPANAWKRHEVSKAVAPQPPREAPVNGNAAANLIVLSDSDEESGSPAGTFKGKPQRQPQQQQRLPSSANGGGVEAQNSSYWSQQQAPYTFFDSNPGEASEFNRDLEMDYGSAYLEEDEGLGASKSSGFRLFLPPQPAREQQPAGHHHHVPQQPQAQCDEDLDDSWFSLSLGGGENSEYARGRDRMDSLTTASVLVGMNNRSSGNHRFLNNNNNNNNRAGAQWRPRPLQRRFYDPEDDDDGSE